MVALLADENFPLPVIHALRALGHDVHTLRDYGQGGQALTAIKLSHRFCRSGFSLTLLA
jgi:hypothetical protein